MTQDRTIIWIPEEPDVNAQRVVEESSLEFNNMCAGVTCQVEIHCCNHKDPSCWVLFSHDKNGKRKNSGGDEFYIRYEEFCGDENDGDEKQLLLQAVAIVLDRNDGSYLLKFSTTPTNPDILSPKGDKGVLTVHFEYSNGIGRLPPPTKKSWQNGGYTHRVYTHSPCLKRPYIRSFPPPSCNKGALDLSAFDKVLAFGDSTMDQFVRRRPNKRGKYYFQSNLRVGEKVRIGLNSQTIETLLGLLHEDFGDELLNDDDSSIALIVGSCLWDILDSQDTLQGKYYTDHIEACRNYVQRIRERYPRATVVWKSPMAVHIHWVDLDRLVEYDKATATLFGIDRVRYMSAYRSRFLYECQTKLMTESLEVPILDLYEATYLSADQLYPSDGRHYRPDLNLLMLSWFYSK